MTAAPSHDRAFSLTEVVIALGLFAFCIVALINLLTVGIQSTGQTEERLEAANIAQELLEMRRIHPVNPPTGGTNINLSQWGFPEITPVAVSGTVYISEEGLRVASATASNAAYRLTYRTTLPTLTTALPNTNCVNVYLSLATLRPAGKLRPYELISTIKL